jgi:hypothetical protein
MGDIKTSTDSAKLIAGGGWPERVTRTGRPETKVALLALFGFGLLPLPLLPLLPNVVEVQAVVLVLWLFLVAFLSWRFVRIRQREPLTEYVDGQGKSPLSSPDQLS